MTAAEDSRARRAIRHSRSRNCRTAVRAQSGGPQAARLPVPVAVRARPVGSRPDPARAVRADWTPRRCRCARPIAKRSAASCCARRSSTGTQVADAFRRARGVDRAADRIPDARGARRSTAGREHCARRPSTLRRRSCRQLERPAASNGSPMPTCASGRCSRPSSTAATTGFRSHGWRRSRSRARAICAIWSGCRRTLQFANGGEAIALIPTRYPGSECAGDGLIALARKTIWEESRPECFIGLGQRVLAHRRRAIIASARPGAAWCSTRRRSPATRMAELTPHERLQPALLDRLTDDEPDADAGSRARHA